MIAGGKGVYRAESGRGDRKGCAPLLSCMPVDSATAYARTEWHRRQTEITGEPKAGGDIIAGSSCSEGGCGSAGQSLGNRRLARFEACLRGYHHPESGDYRDRFHRADGCPATCPGAIHWRCFWSEYASMAFWRRTRGIDGTSLCCLLLVQDRAYLSDEGVGGERLGK